MVGFVWLNGSPDKSFFFAVLGVFSILCVYRASNLVVYFIPYSSYYYSCGSIQGSDVSLKIG